MAASGSATRSVEECEISRSCHSGMPSITGTTWARTILASPLIRSARTGFLLCGMADEPFWPAPNGSASSDTSVRWPCRISIAIASQTVAMSARTLTHSAIPSRSTTWVATSAGPQAELGQDLGLDRRVDVGVGADRPGQLADRDRLPGPQQPVPAAVDGEREVGDPVTPDVRLGVDAVRPADPQRRPVRERMLTQHLAAAARTGPSAGRSTRRAAAPARCPAGPRRSCRSGRRRPPRAGVVLLAHADRNAITSWPVTASSAATASGVGGGAAATGPTASSRHRASLGVGRQHERLDLAPELVLVRLAPDVAHLGQRVAVDHPLSCRIPPARARCPAAPRRRRSPRRHGRWQAAWSAMSERYQPPRIRISSAAW